MYSAISGIAAGLALGDAAAHNIANLSTPGFHRERVGLRAVEPRGGVQADVTFEPAFGEEPAEPVVEVPPRGLHGRDLLTELVAMVIAHAQLGINIESLSAGLAAGQPVLDRRA